MSVRLPSANARVHEKPGPPTTNPENRVFRRLFMFPLLCAVLLVLGLSGCSGDDSGSGDASSSPEPAAETESSDDGSTDRSDDEDAGGPAQVEVFSGDLDDFYVVPDPLPPGEPGDLIRVEDLGEAEGVRTWRVMYHSRDAQDQDRAVTGIVSHPVAEAPEGGWPVVAWAHGTVGMASPCAPSRSGGAAPGFGIEGVHVATDYIGVGPVGERHPYLSSRSQAHSVIDSVRAARALDGVVVDDAWVAVGHSQGGHSALWTNELGESYAPELDLRGTVSIAPAAMLTENYGDHDLIIPRMVGLMALYGYEVDYPEIDVEDYVGPDILAVDDVVDSGCSDDIISAFVVVPYDEHFVNDPIETEPAASVVRVNDPGHHPVDSPLLLVAGELDNYVVPDRVDAVFERLCSIDQVTEQILIPGADHGSVVPGAGEQMTSWLQDRLDGIEATSAC